MDGDRPETHAELRARTREAYDRLAPVWSSTTDEGPFNGWLERPALRSLVPTPLDGATVLDAGCSSGAAVRVAAVRGSRGGGNRPEPRPIRFPEDLSRVVGVPGFTVYRLRLLGGAG